jgi:hypothetical protein
MVGIGFDPGPGAANRTPPSLRHYYRYAGSAAYEKPPFSGNGQVER